MKQIKHDLFIHHLISIGWWLIMVAKIANSVQGEMQIDVMFHFYNQPCDFRLISDDDTKDNHKPIKHFLQEKFLLKRSHTI